MTRALPLSLAAVLAAAPQGAAARRLAVVIGNDQGMRDELALRYAERDAEKMGKALVDLGGFAADEILLLRGRRAGEVRDVLTAIAAQGGAAGVGTPLSLFFFYYSGHSDGVNFHMAGSKLPVQELHGLLRTVPAKVTLALVDSCKSGALTRAKGATLGPSYDINFLQAPDLEGRIVITSSTGDEVSQESDSIEGSFFTHHWVSGLYGAADANDDGLVTLEEAYRYAHFRTVEQTIESQGGIQHPSYGFSLTGQGSIVLANLSHSTARIQIRTSGRPGEYFVLDRKKQLVLTELAPDGARTAAIRLPPGEYRIRKRERHRFLVADVAAEAGAIVTVADEHMSPVDYVSRGAKGEEPAGALHAHGPEVWWGLRSGLINQMGPTSEIRAGYRFAWARLELTPRFALRRAEIRTASETARHWEYDFGFSLGWRILEGPLRLGFGADLGLAAYERKVVRFVDVRDGESFSESVVYFRNAVPTAVPEGTLVLAFQGVAIGYLSYEFVRGLSALVQGYAGGALFAQEGKNETKPVYAGGLGLRYAF